MAKKIDPANAEIATQLRKSEDKYKDVEGRQYVPGSALKLKRDGVAITQCSSYDSFLGSMRETDLQETGHGVCKISGKKTTQHKELYIH